MVQPVVGWWDLRSPLGAASSVLRLARWTLPELGQVGGLGCSHRLILLLVGVMRLVNVIVGLVVVRCEGAAEGQQLMKLTGVAEKVIDCVVEGEVVAQVRSPSLSFGE